ncbi:unnamed protein product [Adineta ricciae]|uniref:protein-tyrosine-phosphatase n=1 Tax=Adineta ricciae TaxID=249248 RepID=A0A814Z0S2_ADIRI|nr:unnamed protein product [Adineta ricciae]
MTTNADDGNLSGRTAGLISEFERTRDSDSTEIGRQFAQLQKTMIESKDILLCNEGAKACNRLKNRYKDVLPYDKCRVVLKSENESDYINASFIEDLHGHRRYIAAQGPIEESITDFFRMISDFQIVSIICTANDVEAGRFKFRRYWPDETEDSLEFGTFKITKDQSSDKAFSNNDYEIRPLIITRDENQQHVLLYHFLHWPDHDIPNDEAPILDLLLRLYQDRDSSVDSPILVHCSAGCGRTGSIIAIDLCRLYLNDEHLVSNKDYQPYPVFKIASYIRQFRIALIQTLKQYFFVHKMFLYLMKANGSISFHSSENNDENQTFSSSPPPTKSSSSRRPSAPLQITLRNPPIGRRLLNGSNISNTPSPTFSSSEFFPPAAKLSSMNDALLTADLPPATIPPDCSAMRTADNQHENETNEPARKSNSSRSDSASIDSVVSSSTNQKSELSSDQESNSD